MVPGNLSVTIADIPIHRCFFLPAKRTKPNTALGTMITEITLQRPRSQCPLVK
jgi:hypothetical protein